MAFTHDFKFSFVSGLNYEGDAEFNEDGQATKKVTTFPPGGLTLQQDAECDSVLHIMTVLTKLFGEIDLVRIRKKAV